MLSLWTLHSLSHTSRQVPLLPPLGRGNQGLNELGNLAGDTPLLSARASSLGKSHPRAKMTSFLFYIYLSPVLCNYFLYIIYFLIYLYTHSLLNIKGCNA